MGPLYSASLIATYSATENSDSSTTPTASVRRRERQMARAAKRPITTPAAANLVPSHGSAPRSTKQRAASPIVTRRASRTASSAAPASAAPAAGSGYTAVPYARSGGLSPTATAAPSAHGSGATRSASRYASATPRAAIAARNSSTAFAPPIANAGAIRSGKPTPCGSFSRPSTARPWGLRSYG